MYSFARMGREITYEFPDEQSRCKGSEGLHHSYAGAKANVLIEEGFNLEHDARTKRK